ncbi:unnamed protein product [Discosporangium mesarthrocarpum]
MVQKCAGRVAVSISACFQDKARQRRLIGHQSRTFDFQFHPSEDFAVSASEDGTARVWDLQNSKCVATLKGHTDEVLRVSWALPATETAVTLATGSADGTVRLWGLPRGQGAVRRAGKYRHLECLGQLSHRGPGLDGQVYSCHFLPGGSEALGSCGLSANLLTASDSSLHFWDVGTQSRVSQRRLLKVGEHSIGGGRNPSDLPFVFDTKIGAGGALAVALSDGTVRVGDLRCTTTSDNDFVLHAASNAPLTGLCWSADGETLVSCAGDGKVTVWDTSMWAARAVFCGHEKPVYGAAFYPSDQQRQNHFREHQGTGGQEGRALGGLGPSSLLLSWSSDGTIMAWDCATASGRVDSPLATMNTGGFNIFHCALSGDGNRLAVAGGGGTPSAFVGMPVRLCDLSGLG